jgi:hypothetical protein
LPQLARALGVPGYLAGIDPYRSSPEQIMAALDGVPLIRLRPLGEPVVAGPDDPGGSAWLWRQALVLFATAALVRSLTRLLRRWRS